MFRTNWTKSYRDVVSASRGGGTIGDGEGGGGGGTEMGGGDNVNRNRNVEYDTPNRIDAGVRMLLRDDQRSKANTKAFLFKQRLRMEEKRAKLAKGRIRTFLIDTKVGDKRGMLNHVLFTCGFKPTDVESLKLNEYRTNQAEVLFKEGVILDIEELEKKIKERGLPVGIGDFSEKEEVMMIYGLPLSNDIENLKKAIEDSIYPFVEKVKEVIPTTYGKAVAEEEDFFGGCFDGNFKVKVTPSKDEAVQVPNFIVIDKTLKVQGKVDYRKKLFDRKNMCLNCFSEEHFHLDPMCPGPREWEEYVEEFETKWSDLVKKRVDGMSEADIVVSGGAEGHVTESRNSIEVRKLQEELRSKMEEKKVSDEENEVLQERVNGLEDVLRKKEEDIRKLMEEKEQLALHIGNNSNELNSEEEETNSSTNMDDDGFEGEFIDEENGGEVIALGGKHDLSPETRDSVNSISQKVRIDFSDLQVGLGYNIKVNGISKRAQYVGKDETGMGYRFRLGDNIQGFRETEIDSIGPLLRKQTVD